MTNNTIKFNNIKYSTVFTAEFSPFINYNEIVFSNKGIAVIYGPNGTGKTCLKNVLADKVGTELEYEFSGEIHRSGGGVFHIIDDQNNRNIIQGETSDFFLGENISRENELRNLIKERKDKLCNFISEILRAHSITKMKSPLIQIIENIEVRPIIEGIANKSSKGNKIDEKDLISVLGKLKRVDPPEHNEAKLNFLQNDISNSYSLILKIEEIFAKPISPIPMVSQVEENSEAIKILNRFHKNTCVVCDTEGIDWEKLLSSKKESLDTIYKELTPDDKNLLQKIVELVPKDDPFQIKMRLLNALEEGNNLNLQPLVEEISKYKKIYSQKILNEIAKAFDSVELADVVKEYLTLIDKKIEITDEDQLFIKEIISNSMNKELTVERDGGKNIRILLSNREVIGQDRKDLPLSAGEQNFLSLSFEFLKAKKSLCPIIVIDDPISSFDSIYKNKIVYAIVKMLEAKKRIILTHNIDLLRLLESQYRSCFNLYLLNNTEGEECGFIACEGDEKEMLISLKKLLDAFRSKVNTHIQDKDLFLISTIPFMRGFANIVNNRNYYNLLTKLMHGYMKDSVDIAKIYYELFGYTGDDLPVSYIVSVPDILNKNVDDVHILDPKVFPLLDKTLRHSFTYLYLRLLVEKNLVEKFSISKCYRMKLGEIIQRAYPDVKDPDQVIKRIRLTSKKTLINEFNHFEGNLSIFQPAIDITDSALRKERDDIIAFCSELL